jgi:hypothetical protein
MDLIKAKLFLEKINREMSRMQADQDQIAPIDIDILKSYVRDLYDACSSQSTNVAPSQPRITPSGPKTIEVKEEKVPEPVRFTPERTVVAPKPISKPELVARPIVETQPTPPPVKLEPQPPPERIQEIIEQPKPPPVAVAQKPVTVSKKLAALFHLPEAKELSEKLARAPISDLRKHITLNDRLQWPKALFGGEMQAFDGALDQLNGMASFEEAKQYLIDQFAEKHNWAHDETEDIATAFILLVGRRFGV